MFDFHCVSKKANLPGLQLADLVARPIGVHYLHPEQHNRAWEMLLPKCELHMMENLKVMD